MTTLKEGDLIEFKIRGSKKSNIGIFVGFKNDDENVLNIIQISDTIELLSLQVLNDLYALKVSVRFPFSDTVSM